MRMSGRDESASASSSSSKAAAGGGEGNPSLEVKKSHPFRRKWDKEYYEKKAAERDEGEEVEPEKNHPAHRSYPPLPRKPLQSREYHVDTDAKLGKTQVIVPGTPLSQQAGFYCDVCDCVVKDSANYLDHINGKKHQRALGFSMRPERSTLDQVRNIFKTAKRKQQQEEEEYNFDERIERLKEEEERKKQERKEKRKAAKKKKKQKTDEADDCGEGELDMAAMGLPTGFGTKSK